MKELLLTMGNKNYSSWSLRPVSPTRRVPMLRHGELLIWDSLAICEYACELAGNGWPRERAARAVARSACAEMHSGFGALRSQWPMNARAQGRITPGGGRCAHAGLEFGGGRGALDHWLL